MLRRLHPDQPESFAFTPENLEWAKLQISKYPEGRQASAIIPLLWRAQEQEGWLTRPAIEYVADMLGMPYMRALEVATFYFMFQLQPVGSVAHVQICGTTSCMLCGSEDLIAVCKEKIAPEPFRLSEDGRFSWEEVECLGACTNAPMAQIGKDYYEDLTPERLAFILDELAAGRVPTPGPQNGRYAAEPIGGPTTLTAHATPQDPHNATVALALGKGDTVKRIDGSEEPLRAPWLEARTRKGAAGAAEKSASRGDRPAEDEATRPANLTEKPEGAPDDLKKIRGVGPKLEKMLNEMGIWHFRQIAEWGPEEVAWVDRNLPAFKGRVSRDNWVEQARVLAAGGATEFSQRVEKGEVYD